MKCGDRHRGNCDLPPTPCFCCKGNHLELFHDVVRAHDIAQAQVDRENDPADNVVKDDLPDAELVCNPSIDLDNMMAEDNVPLDFPTHASRTAELCSEVNRGSEAAAMARDVVNSGATAVATIEHPAKVDPAKIGTDAVLAEVSPAPSPFPDSDTDAADNLSDRLSETRDSALHFPSEIDEMESTS